MKCKKSPRFDQKANNNLKNNDAMNYKKQILEILRDHQPMTIHKFDRLFYENNTRLISWLATVKELVSDQMIKEEPLRITSKGIHELENMNSWSYLQTKSLVNSLYFSVHLAGVFKIYSSRKAW